MTNAEIKKAFKAKIAQLLEEIETQETKSIERTIRLLETLRSETVAQIAAGGSNFNESVYRQVVTGIDSSLHDFSRNLILELNDSTQAFHQLGERLVAEPVSVVTSAPISINRTAVQVAAGYSADLIRGISDDARKAVNTVLRRALVGVITPNEAIKKIGNEIEAGVFKSVKQRAETIVRTEVLRMQSIASHARMKASRTSMNTVGWDMGRSWLTANDKRVRKSHALTNGQVRGIEEAFDVPIMVKGAIIGTEPLMYPRDENASPANTILCRCIAVPNLMKLAA